MNDRIQVMAMPPQEAAAREAEQRDAAAYVARRARDGADRDLLTAALGLAAASLLLLALGRRIQTWEPR